MVELVHTSKAKIHFTHGVLSFVLFLSPKPEEEQIALKSMRPLIYCFKVVVVSLVTGGSVFNI